MLKLHRRSREDAPPAPHEPPPGHASVPATSVDPERIEDVAAWLLAAETRSPAPH
ncbi:MAG: hypothetical protein R2746_15440 [Acidimicrobiales bacterium]|nr:hypothetical protein [Actinomycetota bacterium]